jgi:diacylglycerol kinase (ATP)
MKRTDGWVFIVNPIAGNGYGASCVPIVKEMMARHGADGEVVLTRGKGHATELASEHASRGARRVVGVGGDGTLSEMAQGLVGRAGVTFGAVPAGTGNDFIHLLGFPDRLDDALWDVVFAAAETGMDVGRCNGRYFINGMGLGFDAQVAMDNYHMENGGEVRRGSKAKYTWHIVKNILFYKERPMRVTLEGRTVEQRSFLNTIANGRRLAGGIHITPKALADDGLLDVCMTDPLSVPMRFKELISFQHQTHLSDPVVHYHQVDRARFEFDDEAPAHLDGEVTFARRYDIDVVPAGLRAIFNPKGPHYFGHPAQ